MPEDSRLRGLDGGGGAQLGIYPLLACNSPILVICYFRVRARYANRRARLAVCGVCTSSSVTRMAPVCGSISQTQAGTVVPPVPAVCRARRSWPACVCLNWPGRIPCYGPPARVCSHLQRLAVIALNMRATRSRVGPLPTRLG